MEDGAFKGIRVIEFGHFMAVPLATSILADWGADVIKVENHRTGGDPARWINSVENIGAEETLLTTMSMWFEAFNRGGKRSVALDVTKNHGRETLYRLVETADVFATNFQSAALDKTKTDYDSLSTINPRLIYCQITGYGNAGPDRDQPGFDAAAWWARSGLMDRLSKPNIDPVTARPGIGDAVSSPTIAGAIAAALFARERMGIGQKVELSLYHLGIWGSIIDIEAALMLGKEIRRTERTSAINALWIPYECKDGRWLVMVMPQTDRYWPSFCKAIGKPEWERDPRFDSHDKRMQQNRTLIPEIEKIMATKTVDEWEAIAKEFDLVFGRVLSPLEVAEDPQAWENEVFVEIAHPCGVQVRLIQSPIKFSKTPALIRTTAPELGQHTEEVLLDLGYAWDDLTEFKNEGSIM